MENNILESPLYKQFHSAMKIIGEKGFVANRWDFFEEEDHNILKIQYPSGNTVLYKVGKGFDEVELAEKVVFGEQEVIDVKTPFSTLTRRHRRILQRKASKVGKASRTRYTRKKKKR